MFRSPSGGALRRSTWRTGSWFPATKVARLDGLTFHEFRHANTSLLISVGIDIATVSAPLGHRSPQTTLKVYGRLIPGMDRAAAGALDALAPAQGRPRGDLRSGDMVKIRG